MKLITGFIGKVKDFKMIEINRNKKFKAASTKTIKDTSANKNKYSTVCRRCGRKLTSEVSRNRGYGSYCYQKTLGDLARDGEIKEINFVEEVRRSS